MRNSIKGSSIRKVENHYLTHTATIFLLWQGYLSHWKNSKTTNLDLETAQQQSIRFALPNSRKNKARNRNKHHPRNTSKMVESTVIGQPQDASEKPPRLKYRRQGSVQSSLVTLQPLF